MTQQTLPTDSTPYSSVFVGERGVQLAALMQRYPTKMAALLPALWMVQEAHGWVPEEGL